MEYYSTIQAHAKQARGLGLGKSLSMGDWMRLFYIFINLSCNCVSSCDFGPVTVDSCSRYMYMRVHTLNS